MVKKLTKEIIVKRSKELYGDKFNYDLFLNNNFKYTGNKQKIPVYCKECKKEFYATVADFLKGHNCPYCKKKIISKIWKKDFKTFVKEARKVHGNKYNYVEKTFIDYNHYTDIICPKHGVFKMRPHNHVSSQHQGCPMCYNERRGETLFYTTDEFIKKAKEIHGDKYNYSKVKYERSNKKVCIICSEHGEFWQAPNDHLRGHGCPKCNLHKMEMNIADFLSKNNVKFEQQYKVEWLGRQSLDFYLPEYNAAIECQGEQHFMVVPFWGGEKGFKCRQERDKIKKEKCDKHNIKIYYFCYKNFNFPYKVYTDEKKMLTEIMSNDRLHI